jgi:hypothetical protein
MNLNKNWSVVKIITESGEQVGISEDVPEDVVTIARGLDFDSAVAECSEYCANTGAAEYQGDCLIIDYASYI